MTTPAPRRRPPLPAPGRPTAPPDRLPSAGCVVFAGPPWPAWLRGMSVSRLSLLAALLQSPAGPLPFGSLAGRLQHPRERPGEWTVRIVWIGPGPRPGGRVGPGPCPGNGSWSRATPWGWGWSRVMLWGSGWPGDRSWRWVLLCRMGVFTVARFDLASRPFFINLRGWRWLRRPRRQPVRAACSRGPRRRRARGGRGGRSGTTVAVPCRMGRPHYFLHCSGNSRWPDGYDGLTIKPFCNGPQELFRWTGWPATTPERRTMAQVSAGQACWRAPGGRRRGSAPAGAAHRAASASGGSRQQAIGRSTSTGRRSRSRRPAAWSPWSRCRPG